MAEFKGKHGYRGKKRGKNNARESFVPTGDPSALSASIESAGFSEHTLGALKRARVVTLRDIAARREQEMFHIQNIGRKNVNEILNVLKKFGLDFRPPVVSGLTDGDGARKHTQKIADKNNLKQNDKNIPNTENHRQGEQIGFLSRKRDKKVLALDKRIAKDFKPVFGKDDFIPFMKGGKWGYKDVSGKTLIEPKFDEAFSFKEDLACVEVDGLYGYIDKSGTAVIPYAYEGALSFSGGFAVVTKGEKSGYIDKSGRLVSEFQFDIAGPMTDGKAMVRIDDRWAFLNNDCKIEYM